MHLMNDIKDRENVTINELDEKYEEVTEAQIERKERQIVVV